MKPTINDGFKSSKATQSKRKFQANFEQKDITLRNASMSSLRETLLRVEEEPRKRLNFHSDTESYLEQTPSGRPGQGQTLEKFDSIQPILKKSLETITDDDS